MSKFGTPLCLAFVALASVGCRPPSSKIPLDQLASDDQVASTGETRETIEPLPVERPSDLLPSDVGILVEAIDPATVLGLIGPLDKYPELATVRSELRTRIGADILDPTQWDQLGVDSHGPAGGGLFDVPSGAGFAYLTLADEQKFEQALYRLLDSFGAREQLSAMEVGSARVYRLGREASIVVRERVALLIIVQDADQAPRDYVVTAATIDPREGLGRSERFSWARQQVVAADDGMLFINPSELFRQIASEQDESDDYGIRYAEDALAQAKAANEPPEQIREYEARIAEERRWQQERQVRKAGERKLVDSLFGTIHAFVGAADVGSSGVVGHGRALMPSPNLLRRMFVTPEHESPLLTALAEPPMFVLDGRADLQVLLEVVTLIAASEGQSLDQVNREIQAETGVDVINGLIPALDGEGGIAVTQARKPDFGRSRSDLSKSFGLAAHLGLRDPEAIRKLLDQLARDKQLGGALTRAKRGDGWQLAIPDWHDVGVSIVGNRLIFTTDNKFAARVRDAERGSQADVIAAAEHPLRGPVLMPAARMYARWTGLVQLDAHEPYKQDAESMLYDFNTHATLSPDEAAKVPRSKAFKKKLAELEKVVAELDAVNAKQARNRFERDLAFAESLGDYGMQVEVVSDGLGVTGQWRFAPGMTPLELFAKAWEGERGYDWTEVEAINSRMYTLVDELRAIRQADLDSAAGRREATGGG